MRKAGSGKDRGYDLKDGREADDGVWTGDSGERCWKKMGKPDMYFVMVKDDMQEVGARKDEVFDRSVWRIRCGDP